MDPAAVNRLAESAADVGKTLRYARTERKAYINDVAYAREAMQANILLVLIYFNRSMLRVPAARSKSKKSRHIPLSDTAVELMLALPRNDDIPWVFFNPKTNKQPVSIFHAWDSIHKTVGLEEVRLQALHHSYARFLVNAGRSLC